MFCCMSRKNSQEWSLFSNAADKKKVLFIGQGNICRSPIAEAVFLKAIEMAGVADQWEVDSAAIGSEHVGRSPDDRAVFIMKHYGLAYNTKARQIKRADFDHFDYIVGMDTENISDLKERAPKGGVCKAKILMLGDFDPRLRGAIIRDPYYDSGCGGFDQCYLQCLLCCDSFLVQARAELI